jgi:hypothetical protein
MLLARILRLPLEALEPVSALLFRFRRRRILRRWAQGRLDYSGARWQLQRLAGS